ncbi:NUDIX hydrolase [Halobacillus litoralis]|uniref:NUDIX hydrolase n=1 Tax=Halobacillus litoralis TaxID=45668 RepID=UPI001CD3B614|nr:NUDIX hydrolase [Halobacillus litoralis]MCA0970698.1 NUDIX hydrolase [Halobacillus litoralis]
MSGSCGCFAVVLNEKGQVLLVKRKDYPVWDLPGGTWEEGESLEECAIRETEEETGYLISILHKTGEYNLPQDDDRQHVFKAGIVGGQAISDGPETEKVEWFSPDRLPILMIPHRKKQIKDALEGGFVKETLEVSPWKLSLLKMLVKGFRRVL